MQDYWGVGKATKPMLPLIAIPTTAGTGSECQSFALISDAETHRKMACGDPKAAATVAILDPVLTLTQPKEVTVHTGIDAISHALETCVTKRRSALSMLYSREAFKLCAGALPQILRDPDDVEARGRMLLGAAFAGTAIENSMLGAAHATANPLTARHGLVHGLVVGMMLPHVVRFNGEDPAIRRLYAELAVYAGLSQAEDDDQTCLNALVRCLEELLDAAKYPASLEQCGIPPTEVRQLAERASKEWTAQFNPRPVKPEDLETIYEAAFVART